MINREIVTNYLVRENGKPRIRLSRNVNATVFSRATFSKTTRQKFNYNKINMFIIEQKLNSIKPLQRKFIISMRMDGYHNNLGEYKLAQMNFDYNELASLQQYIGKILADNSEN